jgi:hypothetical protein
LPARQSIVEVVFRFGVHLGEKNTGWESEGSLRRQLLGACAQLPGAAMTYAFSPQSGDNCSSKIHGYRNWVLRFVIGTLIAAVMLVGMFLLLISQKL